MLDFATTSRLPSNHNNILFSLRSVLAEAEIRKGLDKPAPISTLRLVPGIRLFNFDGTSPLEAAYVHLREERAAWLRLGPPDRFRGQVIAGRRELRRCLY